MLRVVRDLSILLVLIFSPAALSAEQPPKQVLRVALFEYLPGYEDDKLEALRQEIEERFQEAHPLIELELVATSNPGGLYKSEVLTKWLAGTEGEHFHVVEIDAQLLGDLAQAGTIVPVSISEPGNHFDVGLHAVTFEGQSFGVPHLLCGRFLFARDPALLEGEGQQQLLAKLAGDSDDAVDLTGDFEGSWTLPALYLDAWMDRNPGGDPGTALKDALGEPDALAVADLTNIIKLCGPLDANICLSGDAELLPGKLYGTEVILAPFAFGHANAYIGYSEHLHYIRKFPNTDGISVRSAPLGDGNNPILFTDAFVVGKNCGSDCQRAAHDFINFMNSDATMAYLLLGRDIKDNKIPRYLLPATKSAFAIPEIAQDRLYAGFRSDIERAVSYPNAGVEGTRKALGKKIKCAIAPSSCPQ
jgi:thiamine pyridinylase